MIWGCMSSQGSGKIAIITSAINAQVFIEIQQTFLISSIENRFDEITFQVYNVYYNSAKDFLLEMHIKSLT